MTHYRHRSSVMKAYQRVVATLAVLALLSAAGFDGIHHAAHAEHLSASSAQHSVALDRHHRDNGKLGDARQNTSCVVANQNHACDQSQLIDTNPTDPSNHGSDGGDCSHCCAAHCFACVMPTSVSILVPWLISKKGVALGLFAAAPPTWRLERPPKTIL